MIIKGFRFGLLLQLAVGPMCIMVFQTAASGGLSAGLLLVAAITLIDGLYIALSGLGIAAVIDRRGVKLAVKIFGGAVLVFFGLSTIVGALGGSILPAFEAFSIRREENIFLKGLLLTASNPLTIIFWSGVFSGQVIQNKLDHSQLFQFGLGCIFSTMSFLSAVAFTGNMISGFLPQSIIAGLNVMVGSLLIGFGIRLIFTKDKN